MLLKKRDSICFHVALTFLIWEMRMRMMMIVMAVMMAMGVMMMIIAITISSITLTVCQVLFQTLYKYFF